MYELHREVTVASGSASCFPNNVSTYFNAGKALTFGAVVHRYQVNVVSWDQKLEGMTNDKILATHPQNSSKLMLVLQAKYISLTHRAHPLLVIATVGGAMVYDTNGYKLLAFEAVPTSTNERLRYTKGIALVGHYIIVGTHTGEAFVFSASSESSVRLKTTLKDLDAAVVDVASDLLHDEPIAAAAAADGSVVCYSAALKLLCKISTAQPLCCVAVYRNVVICGTLLGQLLVYDTPSGELLADVAAHARSISAIAVASESGLLLTVSEDSFVRVWKARLKKPSTFEIECRFSKCVENAPLVGACFTSPRGGGFLISAYDYPFIYFYKLQKQQ